MNYKLSRLASNDLENIYEYTLKKWSINQAKIYYKLIIEEIENICKNPKLGKSISEVKKNHRQKIIKSHIIIYKQIEDVIYIDRILHGKMNIDKRINI